MAMQRIRIGIFLAVVSIGIVATTLVSALLLSNQTIPSTGNLKTIGVGVYWDQACTSRVSSIDWEMMEPGTSKSFTVYVQNNGTVAEVLSMSTGNWNPSSASSQISLMWNCTNYLLAHGSVVGAVLTLSVSSNATGITGFGFDITITGTEST
jgi:hypothetical protein